MPKRKHAALLPTNIALLQNLVRRDPASYKEEFLAQWQHYQAQLAIFLIDPSGVSGEQFSDQVAFIAQVAICYPKETAGFAEELCSLLTSKHEALESELRNKLVQSVMLLRNRGVIADERVVQVLFPLLLATASKTFRKKLYATLVQLVRGANRKTRAQKLNKTVQTLLFNVLAETNSRDDRSASGIWAATFAREMWRRGVWDDARTVEIMKQAALHEHAKIALSGVAFFLDADKERSEAKDSDDSESEDEHEVVAGMKHRMGINKKTSKRARKVDEALKLLRRRERHKANNGAQHLNFSALHLLHDPQSFAERLFANHLSRNAGASKFSLEQRLRVLNLVSRLIGTHKLTVLGIYTYFLKFLTPRQSSVTQFMAAAAQATHDLVPPDAVAPVIRKIADEFVSDGVAPEVAAAGINTIREILARNSLAIEAPLLQDLAAYRGSKSKPVMMAARSLIGLYREVAPEMLARKDRGKIASMAMAAGDKPELKFGVENVVSGIPGLELLEQWRREQGLDGEAATEDAAEWDVQPESDSDDGEWINVESDKEYNVSDDEADAADEDEDEADAAADAADAADDAAADDAADAAPAPAKRPKTDAFASLAATKILTPADFAKLEELRTKANLDKILGSRNEEFVNPDTLTGPKKISGQDKEGRLAAAAEGREDRDKFGSRKKEHKEQGGVMHSSTNKDKARKKNFIMMIHKKDVQGKSKRSLRDKQKVLRAHIEKQKKKGH
ncbi:SDA1-domain-containing protein [Dipodascopsis tothii]|uniref:SDA1-domain-containing protein n=1 Tax=Dipodascopsis tothii TaxID=44089 RepID=UPI0034CDC56F